jgi:hypothetical protein
MKLPVAELLSRLVSRRRRSQPQDDEGRQLESPSDEMPKMPRTVKYVWGAAVTLLLGMSLVIDRGSAWMPLVHRAIDLLQTQTAPTENR